MSRDRYDNHDRFDLDLDETLEEEQPPPRRRISPGKVALTTTSYGGTSATSPDGSAEPRGPILRKANDGGSELVDQAKDGLGGRTGSEAGASTADRLVTQASRTAGRPLPEGLGQQFEASLGADLSGVRVHTDADSARAASAVGARAYALGNNIHFARGQYDAASADGQRLLAHEVAHTVQQQRSGPTPQHALEVSRPGDAAELEADRAASAMVSGGQVVLTQAPAVVARDGEEKKGTSVKLTSVTWPLGTLHPPDAKVSFFRIECGAALNFKGGVGVEPEEEGKEPEAIGGVVPEVISFIKDGLEEETGGPDERWTFDPGGWINPQDFALTSFGKDKKSKAGGSLTLAKVTLFKGEVLKGKKAMGEVTLSVAGMSFKVEGEGESVAEQVGNWEAEFSALPIEVEGELDLLSVSGEVPAGHDKLVVKGQVVGSVSGSVAIDMIQLAKIIAGDAALEAGVEGLLTALGSVGATVLGPCALGIAGGAIIGFAAIELGDELEVDQLTEKGHIESTMAADAFEKELIAPGTAIKPAGVLGLDSPYHKGVQAASQVKNAFATQFLAHPMLDSWRQTTPQAQQRADMDTAFQQWVGSDPRAYAAIRVAAAQMKIVLTQQILKDNFLPYAQRGLGGSRGARVLRLYEQLWPGAWWLDERNRMGPIAYPATVPKACYNIATRLSPTGYPADLSKWQTPPTLI